MSYRAERGAAAVEVALVTPLLVLIILAGVHFGNALSLRHRLAAATDSATRAAALAKTPTAAQVRSLIQGELGSNTPCTKIEIKSRRAVYLGVTSLEVSATCHIDGTKLSTPLTGFLGPSSLDVRAAMPLQES